MILAFSNDHTVTVLDDVQQANSYCESVDVEDGVYTFTDERGFILAPRFATPTPRGRSFGVLPWVGSSAFTLEPTQEQRVDLLDGVVAGQIAVSLGPTALCTTEALQGVLRGGTSSVT